MSTNTMTNANKSESKNGRIYARVGKSLCGEPFLGKNGKELREVRVPNEDPNDKSSWATFVVGANQIHLDPYSEGRLNRISFREDSDITLKKPIITGQDENGKTTYGSIEFKISAKDLKDRFDRMRGAFKEQHEAKDEKPSITDKITGFQKEIENKEKEKPKTQTKKKEDVAI